MKKAVTLPAYSDVRPFAQPSGVVAVQLDKGTNLLATPSCPETYTAAFIAGTEPNQTCDQPGGVKGFFSKILGLGGDKALPPPASPSGANGAPPPIAGQTPGQGQDPANSAPQKKKGIFGKIAGIFKDEKKDDKSSNPPPTPPNGSGTVPPQ